VTDLSKYDQAIVEAAEAFEAMYGRMPTLSETPQAVIEAVKAKREAERGNCSICHDLASNAIVWPREDRTTRYCDFHRPEVVEL